MAVQSACFVIADISGYTNYLTGVELDHAEDILADLIDTVVNALRPPLNLAKLEGDAAFTYTITDDLDGHLLQDTVESTYFAFRRRLRDIDQSTACKCKACSRMGTLDLKFVVHHGKTIVQSVAGNDELVGSDVILVHRLLKNTVEDKLGNHAYALFTQQCVDAMGVDPGAHGMIEHHEEIDIIGDVPAWLQDLEESWERENESQRKLISPDEAAVIVTCETSAPRSLVWKYHAVPELRPAWQGSQALTEDTSGQRRGAGTVNHCAHGPNTVVEHILDWRPPDYATLTSHVTNLPDAEPLLLSMLMDDLPGGGTRVEYRFAPIEGGKQQPFDDIIGFMEQAYRDNFERLRTTIEAEDDAPAVAEPDIKASGHRHIHQPVS